MKLIPQNGYSFLELLTVIVIVAILFGLAIPSYQYFIKRDRARVQVNELIAALNLARSEAIKRHATVTFCKSQDGKTCNGEWRDGWLIVSDKNRIRVYPALPEGDRLIWKSSLQKNNALQFMADGNTHGQTGSFIYCSQDADLQNNYVIAISLTGRIRLTTVTEDETKLCYANIEKDYSTSER